MKMVIKAEPAVFLVRRPEMENQAETAVFSVSKIKKTTNKLCQCTKIYLPNYQTDLFKMLFQSGKI